MFRILFSIKNVIFIFVVIGTWEMVMASKNGFSLFSEKILLFLSKKKKQKKKTKKPV